jgi:hypothetical protein
MLRMERMLKVNTLSIPPKMDEDTRNGLSDMLILLRLITERLLMDSE